MRTLLTLVFALAIGLGAARAQETEAPAPEAPVVAEMAMGAEDAPVTVIEYASFTCPHCGAFHQSVFPEIKANYIDTGKVRLIYREVYFDRFGLWAGMTARCGGPERYFGIVSLLYEKQAEWIGDGDPATISANLRTIAKTAGLTDGQIDACMNDAAMAEALVADFQKNMEADQVEGTPTFIIDGEKYSNMPYDEFAQVLDEKLGG
jgi:protein-disulfide isomerase